MNIQERLDTYLGKTAQTEGAIFIAPGAVIVGDVVLGERTSIWYGSILRADIQSIRIGEGTNIQDGSIIHLANEFGVDVGEYCTVGHGAILHACTVGKECLIGMRATILDGAKIGEQSIVGANSLVTMGFEAPPGSMIHGSPAKVVRELKPEERAKLRGWAEKYIEVAQAHALRVKRD